MLSQCPQCRAIFNVSGPDIEAHHGLVRCGYCRAVFHAVTNEVSDPAPPEPGHDAPRKAFDTSAPGGSPGDTAPGPEPLPEPESVQGPDPFPEPAPFPKPEPPGDARWPTPEPEQEPVPDFDPDAIPGDEPARSEPSLPDAGNAETQETWPPDLPGEVTEEIIIEAPPTIPADFDDHYSGNDVGTTGAPAAEESAAAYAERAEPSGAGARDTDSPARREAPEDPARTAAARAPLKSPYRARDIRMVELPQPRPFKTASLSLLSVFLVLLLVWQVRTFYLDELAQVPLFRPYLEDFCRPLGCSLPPRRDFARIELAGTSISINPEVPGALEIKAGLINQASFPQPYPPLRVTLTDREGRIVGRRTYLPHEYRPGASGDLLPIRQPRDVTINLANPERDVVGYEVELVAPPG